MGSSVFLGFRDNNYLSTYQKKECRDFLLYILNLLSIVQNALRRGKVKNQKLLQPFSLTNF